MPEKKLQDLLQAILRDDLVVEPQYYITDVRTFEETGEPSEERGLVVTMSDGSEFQITIVRRAATGFEIPPRSGDAPPDATRNVEGMSPEGSRRPKRKPR